jgi:hypothetical protein
MRLYYFLNTPVCKLLIGKGHIMEAIFHRSKPSSFFWFRASVLCAVGYEGDQLTIIHSC